MLYNKLKCPPPFKKIKIADYGNITGLKPNCYLVYYGNKELFNKTYFNHLWYLSNFLSNYEILILDINLASPIIADIKAIGIILNYSSIFIRDINDSYLNFDFLNYNEDKTVFISNFNNILYLINNKKLPKITVSNSINNIYDYNDILYKTKYYLL
jgi:hypothetical protein